MKKTGKKKRMKRDYIYGIGKGVGKSVSAIAPAVGLGVGLGAGAYAMGQMGGIGSAVDKLKL